MKQSIFIGIIISLLSLLSGCAALNNHFSSNGDANGNRALSSSETILNCIQKKTDISRAEYNLMLQKTEELYAQQPNKQHSLEMICLNIHPLAGYSQFRKGIQQISEYLEAHPADASGLSGLENILDQLNRERVVRWNLSIENQNLEEQNKQLQQKAAQDKYRLSELKKQIDQLKNIENIIKNRDN